jgi:hypothetical protein
MGTYVDRDALIKAAVTAMNSPLPALMTMYFLYDTFIKSPEEILKNLQDLRKLLIQLSQRYAEIRGYHGELNERIKNEFLDVLKKAEGDVKIGFDILDKFKEKNT